MLGVLALLRVGLSWKAGGSFWAHGWDARSDPGTQALYGVSNTKPLFFDCETNKTYFRKFG